MTTKLNKADVRAWMERWKVVNELEREELQSTPIEAKFRRLGILMHTARALGWKTSTQSEIDTVRSRWLRLKRAIRDPR